MRLRILVIAAGIILASLAAHADTVSNYDISLTTDVGNVSGIVGVDLATEMFSAVDISVVLDGQSYVLNIVNQYDQGTFGGDGSYQVEFDDPTYSTSLELTLPVTSLDGYTGGPVCAVEQICGIQGSYFYYYGSGSHSGSEEVLSGSLEQASATVTPEPSSIALLGSGLLGAAGIIRRRFA